MKSIRQQQQTRSDSGDDGRMGKKQGGVLSEKDRQQQYRQCITDFRIIILAWILSAGQKYISAYVKFEYFCDTIGGPTKRTIGSFKCYPIIKCVNESNLANYFGVADNVQFVNDNMNC